MPEKHALELEWFISRVLEARGELGKWYTSKGQAFNPSTENRSLINNCNDADRELVTYILKYAPWIIEAVRQAPERIEQWPTQTTHSTSPTA